MWLKSVGFPILVAHCMSTAVIPLQSCFLTNSSRFGSFWDNLRREVKGESTITDFAKNKLLDGPNELNPENVAGTLACLSIRFALEFNMDGTARDVTRAQVERHMRLCIGVTTGF